MKNRNSKLYLETLYLHFTTSKFSQLTEFTGAEVVVEGFHFHFAHGPAWSTHIRCKYN